jgi:hypothetical protein
MPRRLRSAVPGAFLALLVAAPPALACGGLIGPNGAVNLLRTTTFVGYEQGIEHYVTAFKFEGGGGAFGSLTPLPGIPSSVEKGGDWTLQRLINETEPAQRERFALEALAAPTAGSAQVIMQVKIDALDITVLKGGADQVGTWAKDHGFRLPPDAPEVLDFYAQRSPIFLAAAFDADAAKAKGQAIGDGTSVHITIPTPNPWVPLRILSLGKHAADSVQADVYLLTDRKPALLPAADGGTGLSLTHDAAASESLLADLRSDRGMDWVPTSAWLTKVTIDTTAVALAFDLAIDASGQGAPSRVQAGLELPLATNPATAAALAFLFALLGLGALVSLRGAFGATSRPTAAGA